jgi:hypothetical protein
MERVHQFQIEVTDFIGHWFLKWHGQEYLAIVIRSNKSNGNKSFGTIHRIQRLQLDANYFRLAKTRCLQFLIEILRLDLSRPDYFIMAYFKVYSGFNHNLKFLTYKQKPTKRFITGVPFQLNGQV